MIGMMMMMKMILNSMFGLPSPLLLFWFFVECFRSMQNDELILFIHVWIHCKCVSSFNFRFIYNIQYNIEIYDKVSISKEPNGFCMEKLSIYFRKLAENLFGFSFLLLLYFHIFCMPTMQTTTLHRIFVSGTGVYFIFGVVCEL